jgi:hypothetical protein
LLIHDSEYGLTLIKLLERVTPLLLYIDFQGIKLLLDFHPGLHLKMIKHQIEHLGVKEKAVSQR